MAVRVQAVAAQLATEGVHEQEHVDEEAVGEECGVHAIPRPGR
jgi:hypothetical protein